jgi:hypothetical protein
MITSSGALCANPAAWVLEANVDEEFDEFHLELNPLLCALRLVAVARA